MQHRELQQLLAGALHEFAAVDCCLTGGHSMQGAELAVGFTVNGVAMRPGEKINLGLAATGQAAGDHRVIVKVQTADRSTPVSKEESTHVYSDH